MEDLLCLGTVVITCVSPQDSLVGGVHIYRWELRMSMDHGCHKRLVFVIQAWLSFLYTVVLQSSQEA